GKLRGFMYCGVSTILLCASALLASVSVVQAWQDKRDNKPVAELELMDDNELASEASEVCIRGAVAIQNDFHSENTDMKVRGLEKQGEARNYLETIERVLRKMHQGNTPKWIEDMQSASS